LEGRSKDDKHRQKWLVAHLLYGQEGYWQGDKGIRRERGLLHEEQDKAVCRLRLVGMRVECPAWWSKRWCTK
jgi:hypothetical protein